VTKLIIIDSSYSLDVIRERKLENVLTSRELDGFFEKLWSVHPIDTHPSLASSASPCGPPIVEQVGENHEFIRGRFGRFGFLGRFPRLNAGLALVSLFWFLFRLARKNRVEIIRAGDPLLSGIIALFIASFVGAKLVIRINGDNDNGRRVTGKPISPRGFRNVFIERMVERFVLTRADLVFIPNLNYGEFARRCGVSEDKLRLVRYGNVIDPGHFVSPHERNSQGALAAEIRESESRWLIHVGRLFAIKHVEDCYEVLKKLHYQSVEATLLYVGDGPLKAVIEERARRDDLHEKVRFVGNLDQGVLAGVIPLCSVALSPHTGRALAEVALGGLPIVAYDLEWQGELVENNVTGLLVPKGDVSAMAKGVELLLNDRVRAATLGAKARDRALEMMDSGEQLCKERQAYQALFKM